MQKLYISTRNKKIAHTPKEAILKGIAEDGGLFVNDWITECKLPLEEMLYRPRPPSCSPGKPGRQRHRQTPSDRYLTSPSPALPRRCGR